MMFDFIISGILLIIVQVVGLAIYFKLKEQEKN